MPTTGAVATLSGSATLPIGDTITYYQISSSATDTMLTTYDEQPIVLRGRLIAKYAKDYQNESEDIPFFTRYHAGGLGTVRGYDNSSLGPRYEEKIRERNREGELTGAILNVVEKSKGGNKLLAATVELQLPSFKPDIVMPYLFIDAGNVFDESESVDLSSFRGLQVHL